ncbi:MAG TPA: immunoglobulin domain-containing protein, partial [Verrucomicrobiae bacterium]
MSQKTKLKTCCALILTAYATQASADTFFSDNFTGGSTLNQTPTTNKTTVATSYQSALGATGGSATLSAGGVTLGFSSNSELAEVMGLFTNSPISLSSAGDNIAVNVVFVNTTNVMSGLATANSTVNIGLFNAAAAPNLGNIVLNAGNTTGGSQNWIGYSSRIFLSGNANIFTRPAQTASGTTSQNQDLLFTGASSSQAFNNPTGTGLGSTASAITLNQGGTYTLSMVITLSNSTSLLISNTLYAGAGTGGTVLFNQQQMATGANFLTGGFNGLAFGWRNSSSAAQTSSVTVASVTVSGHVTGAVAPPTITAQPQPVTVANGGTCAFSIAASGSGVTYQWRRNGTNLIDGGNISGSTSSQLVISPATSVDVLSGIGGYYCTVTGAGNFSTNSVTNSLTLGTAKNLVWSGTGNT